MNLQVSEYMTPVEVLERTASWEEFEAAVQAGAQLGSEQSCPICLYSL